MFWGAALFKSKLFASIGLVQRNSLAQLAALGAASWLIYASITWMSPRFDYDAPEAQRPIPLMLGLFSVAFLIHLAALRIALRCKPDDAQLLPLVSVFAVAYRAVLLFSEPIQKSDIYRYLWDGQVLAQRFSPFRYSPRQILDAPPNSSAPEALHQLVRLRDERPHVNTVLARVHVPELPTVYPPVSQAVFAASAVTTPRNADVKTRVLVMKGWVASFDLITLFLVVGLLKETGCHVGWAIIYGWCPLILKEFANSGHLDSIAVSFTCLAVLLAVRGLSSGSCRREPSRGLQLSPVGHWFGASSALALAVGAKLYPIVLAPLFFVAAWRRLGLPIALLCAAWFSSICIAVCLPMIGRVPPGDNGATVSISAEDSSPPKPGGAVSVRPADASRGLRTFLSR